MHGHRLLDDVATSAPDKGQSSLVLGSEKSTRSINIDKVPQ